MNIIYCALNCNITMLVYAMSMTDCRFLYIIEFMILTIFVLAILFETLIMHQTLTIEVFMNVAKAVFITTVLTLIINMTKSEFLTPSVILVSCFFNHSSDCAYDCVIGVRMTVMNMSVNLIGRSINTMGVIRNAMGVHMNAIGGVGMLSMSV